MKVACTNIVAAPRFRAEQAAESSLARAGALLAINRQTARSARTQLRQDAVDHATGDVGQSEVPALIAVGKPLVIDPQ
jgi:hypothetical protein